MSRKNGPFLIFSALLAALLILFYWPEIANQRAFYLGDITDFYEPQLKFMARSVRNGSLPLWNPLIYTGMSQIAVPSPGMFYPLNWLFFALPFNSAYALSMVLHQLIAGAGMYLLAACFELNPLAAGAAGSAFALCGYMFALKSNYTLVATAAWIPWAAWYLLSIHKGGHKFAFAGCSIAASLMLMAGRPEVSAPGGLVLAAVTLALFFSDRSQRSKDAAGRFWLMLAALVTGLLLAMPALAPAIEWIPQSQRAKGLISSQVLMWSANWYDWLLLILPQPLGDPAPLYGSPTAAIALSTPGVMPFLRSGFVGPVLATAALWGLFAVPKGIGRFLAVVALLFALIASASNIPFAPSLLAIIPGASLVRFPIKLMIFPVGTLCLLAAWGIDCALAKKLDAKAQLAPAVLWASAAVASLLLLAPVNILFPAIKGAPEIVSTAQRLICAWMAVAATAALALCGIQYAYQTNKIGPRTFAGATLAGIVLSMLGYAWAFENQTSDRDFFNRESTLKPALAKLAEADRLTASSFRILTLYDSIPVQPQGPVAIARHHAVERNLLRPNSNMDANIRDSFGCEAAATREYFTFVSGLVARFNQRANDRKLARESDRESIDDFILCRFLKLTATKYAIVPRTYDDPSGPYSAPRLNPRFFDLAIDDPSSNVRIYSLKQFQPRAYFAQRVSCEPDLGNVFAMFINPDGAVLDPARLTVIQTPLDRATLALLNDGAKNASDRVVIEKDLPENVVLKCTASTERLLILCDQYYPGWQASLDGREVDIVQCNAFNRGILVPPGTHTVSFVFVPTSLYLGFALAALGLVALLAIQFYLARTPLEELPMKESAPATTARKKSKPRAKRKGK